MIKLSFAVTIDQNQSQFLREALKEIILNPQIIRQDSKKAVFLV